MICDQCETVAHCTKYGCIPERIGKPKPTAQPAPVQEPVIFYRCNGCGHAYEQIPPTSCDCMDGGGFDRVDYYTSPPAKRKPLTDEQIEAIRVGEEFNQWGISETAFKYVARSIEAAHGIKENT